MCIVFSRLLNINYFLVNYSQEARPPYQEERIYTVVIGIFGLYEKYLKTRRNIKFSLCEFLTLIQSTVL